MVNAKRSDFWRFNRVGYRRIEYAAKIKVLSLIKKRPAMLHLERLGHHYGWVGVVR
jgi:hypothetical protein